MNEKLKSKLWTRASKHLDRESADYVKIYVTLSDICSRAKITFEYADEATAEDVLWLAIQPPSHFARWRKETRQIKKLTDALARLVLGRDKSKCDAKPSAKGDSDDIPF